MTAKISEIQCQKKGTGITPWAWVLLAGYMVLAGFLLPDEYTRWAITACWFAAGLLCVWNFKSCGRYHCAITGPGFLVIGILSLIEATRIITLPEWIEWSVLFAVLAVGFGFEYMHKLRQGTYYRRIE